MAISEKEQKRRTEYIRQNVRQFMVKVNRKLEPDLVDWLEGQENVQAYLKGLARADMEGGNQHQVDKQDMEAIVRILREYRSMKERDDFDSLAVEKMKAASEILAKIGGGNP